MHPRGEPTGISLICRAPGHMRDMRGMDQGDRHGPLPEVRDRFPLGASTCHHHIATWVMPAAASQSARARSSRLIVPPVRHSASPSAGCSVGSDVMRQAVMLFVWTSIPAPWVDTTSIPRLPGGAGLAADPGGARLPGVLDVPRSKVAPGCGADRAPGRDRSQARGTTPNTTSRPAQLAFFSPS